MYIYVWICNREKSTIKDGKPTGTLRIPSLPPDGIIKRGCGTIVESGLLGRWKQSSCEGIEAKGSHGASEGDDGGDCMAVSSSVIDRERLCLWTIVTVRCVSVSVSVSVQCVVDIADNDGLEDANIGWGRGYEPLDNLLAEVEKIFDDGEWVRRD